METNEKVKKVDLGFVGECEPWKLHARFFPSKVGGKPAWLSRRPPQPSRVQCETCKEPLIFLCQIYAPIEEDENAFHRTLFVFICRNGSCNEPNESKNLKVFRSQLPKKNEFYSIEPPNEHCDEPFDDSKCAALCFICGGRAPSHCSKCKKVYYCSKSHQIYDWKNGHKQVCTSDRECLPKKSGILFPEWELTIEEETEGDVKKQVSVDEQMKYLDTLIKQNRAGCLQEQSESELEQYVGKSDEDKTFKKFKKRLARDPEQVLRYDRGGEPLWITSNPTLSIDDIPKCQYCNSETQFECQIMPQLLNFLDLDFGVNSIDWGILAIYTCIKNCANPEIPYKTEHIFKQDLINK